MTKGIGVSICVVLLVALGLTFCAVVGWLKFIIWLTFIAPLISGTISFVVFYIIAAVGQINEDNIRRLSLFISGMATGVTFSKFQDWWREVENFLNKPDPSNSVFIVGIILLFGLVGMGAGLHVGLASKPILQLQSKSIPSLSTLYRTLR